MKVAIDDGAFMPDKAHDGDGGFDLRLPDENLNSEYFNDHRLCLRAHSSLSIDTGVHVQIPYGYDGQCVNKSGLAHRHDIETVLGEIDNGYTGSIVVKLRNYSDEDYYFNVGDKITQLVIRPILALTNRNLIKIDSLEETERGDNGFGSTGR